MRHTLTEVVLPNGAQGLLIHVPQASVMTFDFNFRAGEFLMAREKWEVPHLMEHLLLGANQLVPKARAFQAEFEKNGAYCNASTGSYDIIYESECADFEWDRILNLLLIAITKPLFLSKEFKAEYGNVREELTARSNNHFRHLSLVLREGYGFRVMTDQERLVVMDNVRLKDIQQHYERTHTLSNLRFIIAGRLPASRRQKIQSRLGAIELTAGQGRQELPDEKPKRLPRPVYIHNPTVDNVYFYFDTFMQRRMAEDEADALSLLNSMLTETLYSRILGTARERGLLYSMSSGITQTKISSNWWFGAQVMPLNAQALFDIVIAELRNIFKGNLGPSDIKAAKQYMLGRYQRSAQTVAGLVNGYAARYFFDDVIEDYYQIPNRIRAITKQRVTDIARQLFADQTWGLGALSNCGPRFVAKLNRQLSVLWD